jgi:hypothetical protein
MTDSAMAAAQFVCWGDPKLGTGGKKNPKVPQNDRVAHVLSEFGFCLRFSGFSNELNGTALFSV